MSDPPRHAIHHSSQRDDWPTPNVLFELLHQEFDFTLDVAANADNAKCDRYFTAEQDGLAQDWADHICWMNPTYGRGVIDRWIDKAIRSAARGATVVALVPDRPGSPWYCAALEHASEVRHIIGRVRFQGAESDAPFPSAIFVFCPEHCRWAAGNDSITFINTRPKHRGLSWYRIQLRPSIGGMGGR